MIIAKSKMSVQPGTGDMIKCWSANFGMLRLSAAFFPPQRPQRAQNLSQGEEGNLITLAIKHKNFLSAFAPSAAL